jgi:pSer/pThr/pTyr-binding forkhead associated (FHA) protein
MSVAVRILREGQLIETRDIQESVSLGRAEGCLIRLEDHAISRKHAILSPTEKTGVLKFEKKSEFGWIRHNGQEKTQGLAGPGDVLELGPFQIEVLDSTGSKAHEETKEQPALVEREQPVSMGFETPLPQVESGSDQNGADPLSLEDAVSMPALENESHALDTENTDSAPVDPEPHLSLEESFAENSPSSSVESASLEVQPDQGAVPNPSATSGAERTQVIDSDGATRLTPIDRIQARLVFSSGSAAVEQFDLNQGPDRVTIGRGRNCDIQLQDKKSSRAHVEILRQDGRYYVRDLESANGTFVNGSKIEPKTDTPLQAGDLVQAGDAQFVFEVVSADYLEREQSFLPAVAAEQADLESAPSMAAVGGSEFGIDPNAEGQWGQNPAEFGEPYNDLNQQGFDSAQLNSISTTHPATESGIKGLVAKYKAIPQQRRTLLLMVLAAVVYMGWAGQDSEDPSLKAKKKPKPSASVSGLPVSLSFDDLSKEMQQKVLQGREDATRHYTGGEFEEALLKAESVLSILNSDEVALQIKRYSQIAIQKKKQIEEENARKRQAEERLEKIKTMVADLELKMDEARKAPDKPSKFDAVADQLASTEVRVLDPENTQIKKWEIEIGEFRQKMMDMESSRVQMGDLRKDFESSLQVAKKAVEKAFAEDDPAKRLTLFAECLKLLADIRLKEGFASDEASRGKSSDSSMAADLKAIAKVISQAAREAERCRLAAEKTLEPHLRAATETENARDYVKAFELWQTVAVLDDLRVQVLIADGQEVSGELSGNRGRAGMERIRGVLNAQAKSIYTEGVLAESYSDFPKARQKFKELLEKAPKDDTSIDGYFQRARRKLALYEQFDQANGIAAGEVDDISAQNQASEGDGRSPSAETSTRSDTISQEQSPVPIYDPTTQESEVKTP